MIAIWKSPKLLQDNGIRYAKYSATVFAHLGIASYFDNSVILLQFKHLFKLLEFKEEYWNHNIETLVGNVITHTAKSCSIHDFGKSSGTTSSVSSIEYVNGLALHIQELGESARVARYSKVFKKWTLNSLHQFHMCSIFHINFYRLSHKEMSQLLLSHGICQGGAKFSSSNVVERICFWVLALDPFLETHLQENMPYLPRRYNMPHGISISKHLLMKTIFGCWARIFAGRRNVYMLCWLSIVFLHFQEIEAICRCFYFCF